LKFGLTFLADTDGDFIVLSTTTTSPASSGNSYGSVSSGNTNWSTSEASESQVSNAFTAKSMYFEGTFYNGTANMTLRDDGADTALTCGTSSNACNDTGESISIASGSLLSWECDGAAGFELNGMFGLHGFIDPGGGGEPARRIIMVH